ncbi:hypothetical protein FQ775_12370 [Nitratireductor mangrovi]|uniref:Uncharacterized protein n=1 Tax=Nitratireductor mangrovi TaxID=2599600 RepID=A0A5B8KZB7_9HYPH|nr:hypothetical protein [Nitratireductor mangrovi]QDZ01107.1 hypothetical protein FQ775_12370 [Nitratireductor mangrovi]
MDQEPSADFDEFARRVGRIFVSSAYLDNAVTIVLEAVIRNYLDASDPFEKPRNFSKKTEFIRRFFRDHPDWQFLTETVNNVMNRVDHLADARNAIAHGLIVDVTGVLQGDDIEIRLSKRKKGKERLFTYTFSHENLLQLGRELFVHAVFVTRLGEIVSGNFSEHNAQNILSKIISEVGGPLPVADPRGDHSN